MMTQRNLTPKEYRSDLKPVWCPGCGDYGVLTALTKAMSACGLDPDQTVVVSGIGCSSRLPGFVATYGFHGVHGRALPIATGLKVARPDLTVIAVGGDGDGYSIGGNHLMHCARRNVDITYVVMNNSTYGLTKGQMSPTSQLPMASKGTTLDPKRWKTTPYGATEHAINPMAMAIAWNASFVARGYSYDPVALADLIASAINHRGFALVDALSPCPTFNQNETEAFYRQHTHPVPADHDPTDRVRAFALAIEDDGFPLGILYRRDDTTGIVDEVDAIRARFAKHPRQLADLFPS